MITGKEIVIEYLKKHGYDGLCDPDNECGCTLDDLEPCVGYGNISLCVAAMNNKDKAMAGGVDNWLEPVERNLDSLPEEQQALLKACVDKFTTELFDTMVYGWAHKQGDKVK